MYTYNTKVGFSQVDTDRLMRIDAMTALFQDVTCFQGEDIGNGFALLEPRQQAWILNSWQIEVKRFPAFNECITVGTFPTSFKGFIGNRNFVITDADGEIIVMANSIWTFMDMAKMRPARVDEEFISKYTLEEPLPMDYSARKILLPDKAEASDWNVAEKEAVKVQEYHLDSNNHVNNGQYVRIAFSYLPADLEYAGIRVEYKKQALLGNVMYPTVFEKENLIIVTLSNEENEPYAVIEVERF
jgi:acyl-ACP thioesterase